MQKKIKKKRPADAMVVGEVWATSKYDWFGKILGNRRIDPKHVARLVRSMRERAISKPVLVNEYGEVADGQHTIQACKELGLPVYVWQIKGLSIEDVSNLNVYVRGWMLANHVERYADNGNVEYVKLKAFFEKYGIDYSSAINMLAGAQPGLAAVKAGRFKVKHAAAAARYAEQVHDFKRFHKKYLKSAFVRALTTMFRNPSYDHQQMIGKLQIIPETEAIKDWGTLTEYLRQLEGIYNYHRKAETRIRFF